MRIRWLAPAAAAMVLACPGGAAAAGWSDPLPVAPTPRVRISKPIAHLTVELRRGTTVARRRLGPRPTGYVRIRLPGRGRAARLSAGRYRVTVRAVDAEGRRSAARTVTLRVTRAAR